MSLCLAIDFSTPKVGRTTINSFKTVTIDILAVWEYTFSLLD